MQKIEQNIAIGRRKTSVARVYLRKGSGNISINNHKIDEHFDSHEQITTVRQPLVITNTETSFDILVNVKGGGKSGQAGAIMLGIARALVLNDENNHTSLRANGFLTRDARMVERKKYGRPGARKRFQFSKR